MTWWPKKKEKKKVADIELDMVADMEEDKVADNEEDILADINIDINILTHSPKSENCPNEDPCPQMRTRVGTVILCRAILRGCAEKIIL